MAPLKASRLYTGEKDILQRLECVLPTGLLMECPTWDCGWIYCPQALRRSLVSGIWFSNSDLRCGTQKTQQVEESRFFKYM